MAESKQGKYTALMAVALLLVSSVVIAMPLMKEDSSYAGLGGEGSYSQMVTYHSNNGLDLSYSTIYYGIASTEYNPEYWAGTFDDLDDDSVVNWVGPKQNVNVIEYQYSLNYSVNKSMKVTFNGDVVSIDSCNTNNNNVSSSINGKQITLERGNGWGSDGTATIVLTVRLSNVPQMVFSGWNTSSDGLGAQYYPGDVIPSTVTDLFATWVSPDLFYDGQLTTRINKDTTVPVNSSDFTPYCLADNQDDFSKNPVDGTKGMYSTIYRIDRNLTLSNDSSLPTGTYRSFDTGKPVDLTIDKVYLSGDAIFDNINLTSGWATNTAHGDESGDGIFARGHIMILGTNIDTTASSWKYTV